MECCEYVTKNPDLGFTNTIAIQDYWDTDNSAEAGTNTNAQMNVTTPVHKFCKHDFF